MRKFHAIVEITEPMRRAPAHHHDTWEICYHTGGVGTATIEDRQHGKSHRIDFRPGMIICYPPLLPHYHRSPKGCTMFCIFADAFDPAGAPVPSFTDTPARAFGRTVELLNEEFRAPQGDWEAATEQLLDRLYLLIGRWQHATSHPYVERLKHRLVEHMHDLEFRSGDAMKDLPMSADHLRKLFRKATGHTPAQYLINLRVAEAKRLLKSGLLTAKQVAARVGIDDPYYFSRLFFKATGQRPTVYAQTTAIARPISWVAD
jgi:AraC-like DNA-binding protein